MADSFLYLHRLGWSLFIWGMATLPATGQFWQAFVDALLLDGLYTVLVESPEEPRWQETTYASYPYDMRGSGLYLPTEFEGDQLRFSLTGQLQSSQRDLPSMQVRLTASPISLLSLEANHLRYFGRSQSDESESLNSSSFAVLYNRLRRTKIHGWWGIGVTHVDWTENYTTMTLHFGANYFFMDPVSLHGAVQMSQVGEDFYASSQIRLQLHLKRMLLYGGFHSLQILDTQRNSWVLGTGIYF